MPTTGSATPMPSSCTVKVKPSEVGAVQRYQTEAPSTSGSRVGSPLCRDAPSRSTNDVVPVPPLMAAAFAKSSLAGCGRATTVTGGAESSEGASARSSAGMNSAE